jgi:hypothetical protein
VYSPGNRKFSGYEGEVMHFGINRTTDTLRGVGDLFPLLDYLDAYDEMLFNRLDKIVAMGQVWWDLKLEGFSSEQITEFLQSDLNTNIPPRPGTLWAHNENAELAAKTPDLKSDEMATDAGLLKSHIVASAGWQGTFFDDPGSAGRAVGAEMSEPVFRRITTLQSLITQFLKLEIKYALWAQREAGSDTDEKPFWVCFPPATTRDIVKTGPGMFRLTSALSQAKKDNVITEGEYRQIVATQVNRLGLSTSPMSLQLPADLEKKIKQASLQALNPGLPGVIQGDPNAPKDGQVRPPNQPGTQPAGTGSPVPPPNPGK